MSAGKDKKPEVDDLWGHTDTCAAVTIHIDEKSHKERGQDVYKVLVNDVNSRSLGYRFQYLPERTIKKYYTYLGKSKMIKKYYTYLGKSKTIQKYYTYLGKSKANVSDLFEVKDD